MSQKHVLTLASYVRPDMTSGAMYAAVPMFEVLVPFMLMAPDWAESTVSTVAAEKVWMISRHHISHIFTHRKSKIGYDGLTIAI